MLIRALTMATPHIVRHLNILSYIVNHINNNCKKKVKSTVAVAQTMIFQSIQRISSNL